MNSRGRSGDSVEDMQGSLQAGSAAVCALEDAPGVLYRTDPLRAPEKTPPSTAARAARRRPPPRPPARAPADEIAPGVRPMLFVPSVLFVLFVLFEQAVAPTVAQTVPAA